MNTFLFITAFISVALIVASEGYIAAVVRQEWTYWPVLRVQTATTSARSAHILLIGLVGLFAPSVKLDLGSLTLNFMFGAIMGSWSAYLVWKRNRLTVGQELDNYGRVTYEGKERAKFHIEALNQLVKVGVIAPEDYLNGRDFRYGPVDPAYDAIIKINKQGNITYFNTGAERLLGWGTEDIIGKPVTTIIPERYREMHTQGFERYIQTRDGRLIGKPLRLPALTRLGHEINVNFVVIAPEDPERDDFLAIMRAGSENIDDDEAIVLK